MTKLRHIYDNANLQKKTIFKNLKIIIAGDAGVHNNDSTVALNAASNI